MKQYTWQEQRAVDMVYKIFTSAFYGKTVEATCRKILKEKVDGKIITSLSEEQPIYKKENGRMNKMFINAFIENYGKLKKYKVSQYEDGILITGISINRPQYIIKFHDKTKFVLS